MHRLTWKTVTNSINVLPLAQRSIWNPQSFCFEHFIIALCNIYYGQICLIIDKLCSAGLLIYSDFRRCIVLYYNSCFGCSGQYLMNYSSIFISDQYLKM